MIYIRVVKGGTERIYAEMKMNINGLHYNLINGITMHLGS